MQTTTGDSHWIQAAASRWHGASLRPRQRLCGAPRRPRWRGATAAAFAVVRWRRARDCCSTRRRRRPRGERRKARAGARRRRRLRRRRWTAPWSGCRCAEGTAQGSELKRAPGNGISAVCVAGATCVADKTRDFVLSRHLRQFSCSLLPPASTKELITSVFIKLFKV